MPSSALVATALLAASQQLLGAHAQLTIYQTALATPALSSLVAAINASGLAGVLDGTANFTVLAPVNTAFAKTLPGLLSNVTSQVTPTLLYHAIPGYFTAADVVPIATAGGSLPASANGDRLNVSLVAGSVFVNGYSNITFVDILCSNGVVHLVDTVIEPNVISLVDVAVAAGLTTLASVLTTAGLVPTFANNAVPAAFTVLAPTNAAFAALDANTASWVTNKKNLAGVLQYHAASGAVFSRSLTDGQLVTMLNAQTVKVGVGANVTFSDNRATPTVATVVTANVAAYNGVAHVIDKVLIPSGLPTMDVVATAIATPTLSSLVTALTTASLVTALQAPNGPFTVFAPADTAFTKLPTSLLQNVAKLTTTLKYHVVPGRLYAADVLAVAASATPWLTTLSGDRLNVTNVGGSVYLNGYSTVVTADVDCSNAVVHVVDTVIEANVVSLADVAVAANLTQLVSLVTAAGLLSTFTDVSKPASLTVLAPSNAAFGLLAPAAVAWLTATRNVAKLSSVLLYHVAAGATFSRSLAAAQQITTLNGQQVTVGQITPTVTFRDNQASPTVATVTVADAAAYNGVAHVIDRVLLPTGVLPVADVVAAAVATPSLSSLVAALTSANLVTALQGAGPFTVFAPADTAFTKLPTSLLQDAAKLSTTLQYHVVPGRLYAADIIAMAPASLVTLTGDVLNVTVVDAKVYVNGYSVVTTPDVDSLNGVLHIVDTVIEARVVSLVDVAVASGLTKLVALVTQAGLASTFASNALPAAFTLLAPSDAAFDALKTSNANLYSWVAATRNTAAGLVPVLQYHAAAGAAFSRSLVANQLLTMLNTQTVKVASTTPTVTLTDNQATPTLATVTVADAAAYNGVAHVINRVLLPTGLPWATLGDAAAVATAAPDLSTLVAQLSSAGLVAAVSNPNGPFTIFGPNNAAFTGITDKYSASEIKYILQFHVVNGRYYKADLTNGTVLTTLFSPYTLTVVNDGTTITLVSATGSSAKVIVADQDAQNAALHIVDAVIIPPNTVPTPSKPSGALARGSLVAVAVALFAAASAGLALA